MVHGIQMLAIDLDGTLLRSDGSISQRTGAALRQAEEAGVEIVIATGRTFSEARESLEAIDHKGMLIAAGGSLLFDCAAGRSIARRTMPPGLVSDVITRLNEHGHAALILKDASAAGYDYLIVGDAELDAASKWWFENTGAVCRRTACIEEDQHPSDSIRAAAVSCCSRLAPLATRLRDELKDRCCLHHWSAVTSTQSVGSTTHLLEVFDREVNKWTMVLELCKRRSMPPGCVAAIGDGLNDVELLAGARVSIAMANACAEAAAAARCATLHHDEDGVAVAVERLLAGEWA